MPRQVKTRDPEDWADEAARVRRIARAARKDPAHGVGWRGTVGTVADTLATMLELEPEEAVAELERLANRLKRRLELRPLGAGVQADP